MAADRTGHAFWPLPLTAAVLLWPAIWNGYPIVFADTGTYLSQAIHHYLGWDRPPFYSLFMLPLHLTVSTWPVILAQALLTAWVLHLVVRALLPGLDSRWLPALGLLLAFVTWLPFLVCQLMPDVFTPLLALVLCLLGFEGWVRNRPARNVDPSALSDLVVMAGPVPMGIMIRAAREKTLPLPSRETARVRGETPPLAPFYPSPHPRSRKGRGRFNPPGSAILMPMRAGPARMVEGIAGTSRSKPIGNATVARLVLFAAFMVAAQQSSLLLAAVVLAAIAAARVFLRLPRTLPWPILLVPPAMAATALLGVNLLGHGRPALSPFGNIFLLARVIYDGPGMDALRRDCPERHWRLCAGLDRFPPTSDDFLWRGDSPILDAGGHKVVAGEANAIIVAAVRAEPIQELRAILGNGAEQLCRFESGDGLEAWPIQVTPWIDRDFPPEEQAAYAASRQARGVLALPAWVAAIHFWVAIAGVILCLALLPIALWRRDKAAGYLLVVLIVLPASALITGGLSTPHDRYQSRVMWLAPCVGVLSAAAMAQRSR